MAKTYYFVFCKEDLLLEKTADGGYTIRRRLYHSLSGRAADRSKALDASDGHHPDG